MDSKKLIDSLADYMARYHSTSMPTTKSQFENIVIRWIRSLPKEQREVVLTMVNKSSKQTERIGIDIGRMDSQQLIDSLLDHRALYHSASTSASKPAKSQFRNNVIGWICSLTVEQRQAALMTVDEPWVTILLQMHERIERDGPGFFILLPDMPMKSEGNLGSEAEALPSLCYRKAKGLLARVQADNEHERVLAEGVRLFSSTEGQFPAAKRPRFDSLVLEEDLVADADRFVAVMDKISNDEFLRGAGPASGSRWEELPWLIAKGYYSLAAFVANKLELSLRLAWLNSHGKKKTCRVIDRCSSSSFVGNGHETAKNGVALPGFAENVFWRKKGCVHWWSKVDCHEKAKAFKVAVAKAVKFEVIQLDRNMKNVESNKAISAGKPIAVHKVSSNPRFSHHDSHLKCHSFPSYLCRKESGSCNFLGGLYILQEVSLLTKVPEDDSLFFCSLKSADTISDNIMRRVREVLAKVSKDFVELDLLREENTRNYLNNPKAKSAEVPKKEKRRKGRSKKKKVPMCKQDLQDACPNQILDDTSPDQITCEDQVPMMNNEEDSGKGIISSAIDPGMTKITIKKEKIDNLICQEENNMSPCGLLKNLETKQPSSGMGETQVKRNKQGRGRSKLKKKNTANLDATLLSNGKDRKLGDYCEQPQHEVGDIQQGSSLEYSICDQDIDGSGENFCSQSTNFASSLISSTNICTVDKDRACSAELPVTSSDELGHKGHLSESDFHDKRDANSGSSFDKECLISVMNSHVLCKPNSLDINDDVARMDSSLKSNISERDKGDANFLSIDCKSTSGSLSLLQDNLDGSLPSTATDLSYPVHQGELNNELKHEDAQCSHKPNTNCFQTCNSNSVEHVGTQETSRYETQQQRRLRNRDHLIRDTANFMPPTSYEWPGSLHFCFPSATRNLLPAATDRLHLDVDWKWQHRSQPTFVTLRQPMVRNSSWQGVYHKRNPKSQAARKGLESSPVVPTGCNLTPSMGYSLEAGFTPFLQRSFQAGCVSSNMELNGHMRMKEDSRYEGTDDSVRDDLKYVSGDTDDFEGYAISEDEGEKFPSENASNNVDNNQVFGGGVMYWNTADYAGTGYSRPPSLSSEDSSWARHEDDLKLVIEDIVSLPPLPGPYGNGGVTSPPTTFHSTFDHYCPVTPTTPGTFVKTGNDFTGNFTPPGGPVSASEEQENRSINKCSIGVVDGIKGEAFSHPILRPIIIPNPSKQRPRNEAHSRESRSPCLPRNRREPTRLKRPPSPVVLCVPPAPPPPPPSPVGGFRNQRRFPNVRSGSSSPRHWGISGWPNEAEIDVDDHHMSPGNPEVVSFGWRRKCITATPTMHSLSAALLRDRLVAIPQSALEQEHPDIALPLQSASIQKNPALQASVPKLHSLLHDEIESFCKQVAAENLMRKQFVNAALEKVSRALQVLWPRSRTKIFGSIATGLALPTSGVDLVVCLPPVRNLEPIKEAGILEGRNGIKETCLQHAARYLADQEWVKSDSLKTIENTVIPIIKLEVEGLSQHCNKNEDPLTLRTIRDELRNGKEKENMSNTMVPESSLGSACETRKTPWGSKNNRESVRLDISFESRSHTGLKTANLVRELTGRFPAIVPLALVLKQFLTDRSLDHPYSGGLSSYCLVLLITRFLQHEHHAGRAINQNLGGLFMDFLYFFGCVFDPCQMGVSIYGSGMYTNRDRGQSIDPLHIDDPFDNPLHPANNVGRNCFRIHQCTKAFADAHSVFQKELLHLSTITDSNEGGNGKVLPKIIPSIADMYGDKI